MRILLVSILFWSLFACSKSDKEYVIENLNNNKITILGHGGFGVNSIDYPLNSIEAIMFGIAKSADGAEIDIQLSKDSVLVAFHDGFLEESTFNNGQVHEFNWSELKDFKYKTGPYNEYKIINLETVFEKYEGQNLTFTLDIKLIDPEDSKTDYAKFRNAIYTLITKYNLISKITIESTSINFLKALKLKDSNLQLFYYTTNFNDAISVASTNKFRGITLKAPEVSKEQVKQAHDLNLMVAVFGANAQNHDETIKKNVDIIQTDNIPHLVKMLKGGNSSTLTNPY